MALRWTKAFKREKIDVLGLDIGSSQVKTVQLRKDHGTYTVVAAGMTEIKPCKGDANGQEVNTAKAIRKCLDSSGAGARMAVCGVSGPEVAVRHFRFPSLPKEEVAGAVLLEAGQVCPFHVDAAAVDYQLIPDGASEVCGVLVAATNKLVERKKQLAQNASLGCVLMDVDGLALLNCFNELQDDKPKDKGLCRTTAILNVGSTYTTLAIMAGNNVPFIRETAYAGNDILDQIASERDISVDQAATALFDGSNAGSETVIGDSLAGACRKLILDVTETLRYYGTQHKNVAVDKVFVCGGFALAKGFVGLLDARLPARAILWNPFEKIRWSARSADQDVLTKKGPAMAVAAGLAMRSI